MELILSPSCLESFERWVTRRQRHAVAPPRSADTSKGKPARGRKHHKPRTVTEARERQAARTRIRLIGLTASIAFVAYGLITLAGHLLVGGKR